MLSLYYFPYLFKLKKTLYILRIYIIYVFMYHQLCLKILVNNKL